MCIFINYVDRQTEQTRVSLSNVDSHSDRDGGQTGDTICICIDMDMWAKYMPTSTWSWHVMHSTTVLGNTFLPFALLEWGLLVWVCVGSQSKQITFSFNGTHFSSTHITCIHILSLSLKKKVGPHFLTMSVLRCLVSIYYFFVSFSQLFFFISHSTALRGIEFALCITQWYWINRSMKVDKKRKDDSIRSSNFKEAESRHMNWAKGKKKNQRAELVQMGTQKQKWQRSDLWMKVSAGFAYIHPSIRSFTFVCSFIHGSNSRLP